MFSLLGHSDEVARLEDGVRTVCKRPAGGGGWRKYCYCYGVLIFLERADADVHPFRYYDERVADVYAVKETAYLPAVRQIFDGLSARLHHLLLTSYHD